MGLDIYFFLRKKTISSSDDKRLKTQDIENSQNLKKCAYFRKVNFLIPHFNYKDKDNNTYNCEYVKIDKKQIRHLITKCKKILSQYEKKHTIDENILPTQTGFFFGSDMYDEEYIEKVNNVLNTFNDIYAMIDEEYYDILMYCSW